MTGERSVALMFGVAANPDQVSKLLADVQEWNDSRSPSDRIDLSDANLSRADLSEATLALTPLARIDSLSQTLGLEQVHHLAPSPIGTDTLAAAQGRLPAEFLKGCGLQDWEIEYAKLFNPELSAPEVAELLTSGVFHTRTEGPLYIGGVFISYSHVNSDLVLKLYARFEQAEIRVWLDRHDLVVGSIERQITSGIRLNDVVVLVLSKSSLASEWVWDEIETAAEKEKAEDRDILCLLRWTRHGNKTRRATSGATCE